MAAQTQALLRRSFSVQFHGGSLAEWHGCWETNARTRVQEYALVFPFKKIGCQTSSCHASMPVLSSAVCACKSMCNLCFVCVCVCACVFANFNSMYIYIYVCIYTCISKYLGMRMCKPGEKKALSFRQVLSPCRNILPLQKGQKECT